MKMIIIITVALAVGFGAGYCYFGWSLAKSFEHAGFKHITE